MDEGSPDWIGANAYCARCWRVIFKKSDMIDKEIIKIDYIFERIYHAGNGPIYFGHTVLDNGQPDPDGATLFCMYKEGVEMVKGDRATIESEKTETSRTVLKIWINGSLVWENQNG